METEKLSRLLLACAAWGIAAILTSCAAAPSRPVASADVPAPAGWAAGGGRRIMTVSWTLPDSIVVSEANGAACSARSLSVAGSVQWERALPFCPDRADVVSGGMVLFQSAGQSLVVTREGSSSTAMQVVAAASADLLLTRSGGFLEVPGRDFRIPDRGVAGSSIADRNGQPTVVLALQDERGARTLVREPDHKVLSPSFPAIDSFDLSSDGREVVFSARKEGGSYDVALVSTDGGDIHPLPSDPADEVAVRWAPAGYRAGYLIRRPDGDLFRSIQISTSAQLIVDFPLASATSWSWSSDASRIAIITSTPDQADHVEVVSLNGIVRHTLVEPRRRAGVSVETVNGLADTILTRPALMKYNEIVPLVVWTEESMPLRWDDARGDLATGIRSAAVVTPRSVDHLGPDFWARMRTLPWIDSSRIYVVGAGPRPAALPDGATWISVVSEAGRSAAYREERSGRGGAVLLTASSPPVVKSLAASYITNRLKGTSPPNDQR